MAFVALNNRPGRYLCVMVPPKAMHNPCDCARIDTRTVPGPSRASQPSALPNAKIFNFPPCTSIDADLMASVCVLSLNTYFLTTPCENEAFQPDAGSVNGIEYEPTTSSTVAPFTVGSPVNDLINGSTDCTISLRFAAFGLSKIFSSLPEIGCPPGGIGMHDVCPIAG